MSKTDVNYDDTPRLQELEKYQIMDSGEEQLFELLAESAAKIAGTESSAICFLNEDEQFFKAACGMPSNNTIKKKTLCRYSLNYPSPVYFLNTKNENQEIQDLAGDITTYLGVQIKGEEGHNIGILCVFDDNEIKINQHQIELLKNISKQITALLKFRFDSIQIQHDQNSVQLVINNIAEGFWDWHLEKDYEYLSPKLWEQLGYDPDTKDHHPSEWQKLIHPDDLKLAFEKYDQHVKSKGKIPFRLDVKYKHAKGHWHWIKCEGQVVEWKGDQPVRMVGTHKDIHEEKQAENIENIIQEIQASYIHKNDSNYEFFNYLLNKLLNITESEYAFIGEVLYKEDRSPYLKTFALTDISWNNETAQFYRDNAETGVEFFNMETLFGEVITSGKTLITNEALKHPKSAGIPEGHPDLNAFLGVPFYFQGEMNGMIGLANRNGGYSEEFVSQINKVFQVCAELIGNFRLNRKINESNENKIKDFERVLSATPSCLKIVNRNGELLQMNPQGLALIGAENMEQVQNACVYDLVEESHRDEWIKFNQSICDGHTKTHRFEIISLDGTRRWMETYAAPIELTSGESAHIAITNDITKKLQQEKNNQFILDTMKVGTWDWDITNNQLYWDDANYKVFGVAADTFNGAFEAWEQTLHPDYKEEIIANLNKSLEKHSEYNAIFPIVVGDQTRYVGAKALIVRDNEGKAIKMYGINWDRTEEHRLSLELDEQKKVSNHNAKLASLGEMAAGIGHEINNPMAIISGNREIIEQELNKSEVNKEVVKKSVEKIASSVSRVTTIVNGLKTFSRIDQNELARFDVTSLLNETVGLIGDLYRQDGLVIDFDFSKPLYINGTKGRVQQVLINLFNNAKDAMETKEVKLVQIVVEITNKNCTIAVTDKGEGIPSSLQHRIFDPFFTSKDVNKGTGIGLSLCHKIMQEHNGEISFSSQQGVGTTFYLNFPLSEDQSQDAKDENVTQLSITSPETVDGASASRGHVLLADDEEDLRELIEFFLETAGFTVTTAENGLEAYEKFTAEPTKYDLLLSDLKMPKMDGLELVVKVANEKSDKSNLKIVIMTGGINQDYSDKTSEVGKAIDACLTKPFVQEDLIKIFDELFPAVKELAS